MRSRRRIVGITVALLLLLDIGRSMYARLGAAYPTRLWSAETSYAQPIAWPPGSDLRPEASPGARLYAGHCAICHGPGGHGNGPAAPSLHPRPRDFTGGVFKLKSTGDADPPALADVRAAIQYGMPGSSMPAWADVLSAAEIDTLAEYVRSLGPHASWASVEHSVALPPAALAEGSADLGRELFSDLGCASCHGEQGRGDGPSATQLKDVWNQSDPPRDLTAPWTFRGGGSPQALYTRVARGMGGTPMPGYAEVAEPAQLANVVAFIRSIARTPPWEPGGTLDGPGASTDLAQRGEYLVHAGMCGLCHTPVDANGIYLANTHYLAGGMKVAAGAHGVFFTRNLTSDPDTGLGTWTAEQVATAIRTGHTPTRRLNFWGMPWMVLGALSDEDALAIGTYLKTLPPVHNLIPAPLHYGVAETVLRKLTYGFPASVPERLSYYAGNFGYEQPTPLRRDLPQSLLVWAQIGVLIGGLIAWTFTRAPRAEERSLGLTLLAAVLTLAGAGAGFLVYRYPAVDMLPSPSVITGFAAGIPAANTEGADAARAALLQRGRYLYGVASCPYCHNGNGAGGGKVNWQAFGTTWARNLTAHPSGLADWSDAAVLRAMISGVGRDGRPLHWQAMIWDHLSNYSVEDQHALLAYVRTLPAVERASPAPISPNPNDCAGDTFWVGRSNSEPGCK
jgi:mono/diheme cytochrome c family protein